MFLQDRRFDLLVSAGFAGALDERLKVGDLLLAQNFSTANVAKTEVLLSKFSVHVGDLFTTMRVIDSPEDRNQIARSTGAAAVDMETDFIARICAEHALPMLSLRVISDSPARPLPLPPRVLFDIDEQKTKLTRLAAHTITHPNTVWRLMRFARQVRIARENLTRAIVDLLRREKL